MEEKRKERWIRGDGFERILEDGRAGLRLAVPGNGVRQRRADGGRGPRRIGGGVRDVKEWAGQQVGSLESVNERVAASTKEIVSLFGELDYNLAFRENGIGFSNAGGVEGIVGVQGNLLVLDVAFPGDNAEAAHTVTRILTVFSDNNWAEDRVTAITNADKPQTVQLETAGSRPTAVRLTFIWRNL